jgi:PadR family transcriptional regulator PadR
MGKLPFRLTLPTQLVLRAMLRNPADEVYGLELCQLAGLPSGTVQPILARLERCGWATSRWEDVEPAKEGRARRRYYRLAPDAVEQARYALAAVGVDSKSGVGLLHGLAGGQI